MVKWPAAEGVDVMSLDDQEPTRTLPNLPSPHNLAEASFVVSDPQHLLVMPKGRRTS